MSENDAQIVIAPANSKAERAAFVDLGRRFSAETPFSVPQLRSELLELVDHKKNPFFDHARVQLFMAFRDTKPVGRISAHIDELALELPIEQGMGPRTGMFGYFDAEDEAVGRALLTAAEKWLRGQGMTRILGPISMSIWEEPGLLTHGHDHAPTIMMGHHPAQYQSWIENFGFTEAKKLLTFDLDVTEGFSPLIQRIVQSGKRNERIKLRRANKKNFGAEARIILGILNDAWSDNWGFVPFTEREIDYASKKLKPLVHPDLVRIMELDGRPVAFMIALPDVNKVLAEIGGKMLPFGWFKLLRWAIKPMDSDMRVPLMGVLKEFHNSRLASQLAFMMIEAIRKDAYDKLNTRRAEIGWILDDNQGMIAIADAIESKVNREYTIYQKPL